MSSHENIWTWTLKVFIYLIQYLYSQYIFLDVYDSSMWEGRNIYDVVFYREFSVRLLFFVLFFTRAISDFFFYYHQFGCIERGREVGERGRYKSADKGVRFIASLILFIDTRIALRLRLQRLRRRNLVVKLGRVKTRLASLFTRAILPPTLHTSLFPACR